MPRDEKIPKYSHGSHTDAVVKASKSTNTTRAVLLDICRRANYRKPESTFTKDQLCETVNTSRPTVQSALVFLRNEGTLRPIKHFSGGKGHAVTYRICIAGKGDKIGSADDVHLETEEGRRDKQFKALARKFGPLKALDMMNSQ